MLSKLFQNKAVVILVLIVIGLGVFWVGYQMLKSQTPENDPSSENQANEGNSENSEFLGEQQQDQTQNHQQNEADAGNGSPEMAPPLNEEKLDETEGGNDDEPGNDSFINISPTDCTRDCEPYKYYEDELEYCRQVCGIIPPDIEADGDCDGLEDLEKDYCLKNSAIVDLDSSICEKIEDENIKDSCKKRIVEDILEKNKLSN